MKLNRLETHDRLLHFKKDQAQNIFQGCEECLKKNPLSLALQEKSTYIYIFAHPRTDDDGVTKKMYWQPRLSKPEPQTNSYLFRAISHTDMIEVIWLLPPIEQWKQYGGGKVTESNEVIWSINQFTQNRARMSQPEPEDLPDEMGRLILKKVIDEHVENLRNKQRSILESVQMEKGQ
jgi:hypothetical protein